MKKIRAETGFLLTAAAAVFFMGIESAIIFLAAIAAHELGHYICLRIFGVPIEGLRIRIFGLCLIYDGTRLGYFKEIAAALAGPAASGVFALLCAAAGYFTHNEVFLEASAVSALLGAFNLLPVRFLDGGRALYMLTAQLADLDSAEWEAPRVGAVTSVILFAVMFYCHITLGGMYLPMLGALILLIFVVNESRVV